MPLGMLTYFPGTVSWPHPPGLLPPYPGTLRLNVCWGPVRVTPWSEPRCAHKHWGFWEDIHIKMPWWGFATVPSTKKAASTHPDTGPAPCPGVASGAHLCLLRYKRLAKPACCLSHPFNSSLSSSTAHLESGLCTRVAGDAGASKGSPTQGARSSARDVRRNEEQRRRQNKALNALGNPQRERERESIFGGIGEHLVEKWHWK